MISAGEMGEAAEEPGGFLLSIFVLRTSLHCSPPSPPVREVEALLLATSSLSVFCNLSQLLPGPKSCVFVVVLFGKVCFYFHQMFMVDSIIS